MKKVLSIIVMIVLAFTLSGCRNQNCDTKIVTGNVDTTNNSVILVINAKNEYYTFEDGYYYFYRFNLEGTNHIFRDGKYKTWFR